MPAKASPRKLILVLGLFALSVFLLITTTKRPPYVAISEEVLQDVDDLEARLQAQFTQRQTVSIRARLREVLKCRDNDFRFERLQNGEYWILKNYVRAGHGELRCHESITYTTHGDYTFLDNIPTLVARWAAPVSMSLHAPGYDFPTTIASIKYLQKCLPESPLIQEFVTFHIYFHNKHMPEYVPQSEDEIWATDINCSQPAPYLDVNVTEMYKSQAKLIYPINLGRNIARKAALTHFVFASDVELYPSPGLVENFLEMAVRNASLVSGNVRSVFPIPVFEIEKNEPIPNTKTELQRLLAARRAIPFHEKVCITCHAIPHQTEWMKANETDSLDVFTTAKRMGRFRFWEPFYIGTNADPIFDERVSWEGQRNKMVQCYVLCLLDYDFNVLNNAFLIHSPGIKVFKPNAYRAPFISRTHRLVQTTIMPQLQRIYGSRKGCVVGWNAPISIALYAPGSDFQSTIKSIDYLQNCVAVHNASALVSKFVTFHIFFPASHMPFKIPKPWTSKIPHLTDCSRPPPFAVTEAGSTYRKRRGLAYPINVARNVAKRAALTHFVLVSDVELYPSAGFAWRFLNMVARNASLVKPNRVFPLAVFEVAKNNGIPLSKSRLVRLLSTNAAVPFHETFCPHCHTIPGYDDWLAETKVAKMGILTATKRLGEYARWEPLYVGTKSDPDFDERFTWEGQKDKMVQMYAMCLLNYDFLVLNDGFLVHRPGIKTKTTNPDLEPFKQIRISIEDSILPEYYAFYGERDGCLL